MTLAKNRVHQGDCVDLLNKVAPESIDLVFADPPFNIGYEYDVYDDAKEADDYLSWCGQWIGGVHRALKPNGTFWLAIGDEYAAELKIESQKLGFHCRSWVILVLHLWGELRERIQPFAYPLVSLHQGPQDVHLQSNEPPNSREVGTAIGLCR